MRSKISTLAASLFAALTLAACNQIGKPELNVAQMRCTDLAREIGRYTQMRDEAQIDSFAANIEGLVAEKDSDRMASGIESLTEDITEDIARDNLEILNTEYARRRCR